MADKEQSRAAPRLSSTHQSFLGKHGWVVVKDFVPMEATTALREDLLDLRRNGHFRVAKIGHDGSIQDEQTPYRDIRHSETCSLAMESGSKDKKGRADATRTTAAAAKATLPDNDARHNLFDILNELRHNLQESPTVTTGRATKGLRPLDDAMAEVMYAYYPVGGCYRRHCDAEKHSASAWRQYSFLLYLNDSSWTDDVTKADDVGGQLRLHRDSGTNELPADELPNFIDIPPTGGTLVVFRSDLVPHEVLPTKKERAAVVGWFLAAGVSNAEQQPLPTTISSSTTATVSDATTQISCEIHPETLKCLRALREAVPKLKQKLEPAPPPDHSGLIQWDDWGAGMGGGGGNSGGSTAPPKEDTYPDTDPRYWKAIVALDEDGRIATLSLGGQRLRKVPASVMAQPALLGRTVTLDLANSDLPIQIVGQVLDQCPNLRQLYLGGNALGDKGLAQLAPHLFRKQESSTTASLQVLDLRYNDLGPDGAALVADLVQKNPSSSIDKLYLEGNTIGDAGAEQLAKTIRDASDSTICATPAAIVLVREVYLGQNRIGPYGASAMAKALVDLPDEESSSNYPPRLEKLYLEGNSIGDDGARSFRLALEGIEETGKGKKIDKLYFDNNGVSKTEAIRLGQAVQSATVIGDASFFK